MQRPSSYQSSGFKAVSTPLKPVVEASRQAYTTAVQPATEFGAAYAIGAAYLFLAFSHATEFIDVTGRLHLVVFIAFFGAIAALSAGQIPKSFSSKAGMALTIFTVFLVLGIPFSSWKGGSFRSLVDIWSKSYIAFFLVSSLIFTMKQMRKSLFLLAMGTIGIVYFAFKATKMNEDGRLSVEYGSLGNSNDLAGSLLIGLPFLMYVLLDKKRSALIRLLCLGILGILLVVVFKTGSRSGVLALIFMAFVMFLKASAGSKLKIVVVALVVGAVFPMVAGKTLMARYKTMFTTTVSSDMSDDAASAVYSSQARRQLVYNAIELTLRHPIFGVGLGNFANQSADLEISKGNQPLWFTSHDIYLLVSSETGVVGIVLYLATIFFTFSTLIRIERAARKEPELADLQEMAYCLLLSTIAFTAGGLFSTNAYTTQLPLLAGLTVALDRVSGPVLHAIQERRLVQFRESIPVAPSRHASAARSALSFR